MKTNRFKFSLLILVFCGICIFELKSNAATFVSGGKCGNNLTWELNDEGVLTISGTGEMEDYWTSRRPAPWYYYLNLITSVNIEYGVTTIGECAFDDCGNITSIKIPDSVTSIGEYAFNECRNLVDIHIPQSVEIIGHSAFEKCSSLKEITIPEGVTVIESYLFMGCGNLSKVNLPKGITGIRDYAFDSCDSLTEIVLPEGVDSIGSWSFSGCDNLISVVIPKGVKRIGQCAFSGCFKLTDLVLPDTVTSISYHAFSDCHMLTRIEIPEGVERLFSDAFSGCINLKKVLIPKSVTFIEEGVFYACDNLEVVLYAGNENEWQLIQIEENNEALKNACFYYNGERPCEHDYDNACDTNCNICGVERAVTHTYETEWCKDIQSHWQECNVCGNKTEEGEHIFTSISDKEQLCKICQYKVTLKSSEAEKSEDQESESGKLNHDEEDNGKVESGIGGTWGIIACIAIVGIAIYNIVKKRKNGMI